MQVVRRRRLRGLLVDQRQTSRSTADRKQTSQVLVGRRKKWSLQAVQMRTSKLLVDQRPRCRFEAGRTRSSSQRHSYCRTQSRRQMQSRTRMSREPHRRQRCPQVWRRRRRLKFDRRQRWGRRSRRSRRCWAALQTMLRRRWRCCLLRRLTLFFQRRWALLMERQKLRLKQALNRIDGCEPLERPEARSDRAAGRRYSCRS